MSYEEMWKDLPEEVKYHMLKLTSLEVAGVDNWSGYDHAMEIYNDMVKQFELEDE